MSKTTGTATAKGQRNAAIRQGTGQALNTVWTLQGNVIVTVDLSVCKPSPRTRRLRFILMEKNQVLLGFRCSVGILQQPSFGIAERW